MRMTTEKYIWMLSELSKLSANDLTRCLGAARRRE